MGLVETLRNALRIKTTTFDEPEIEPLIEACKIDLYLAGVNVIQEDDPLFVRAATLYAKANFGFLESRQGFADAYEKLKQSMALSQKYGNAESETE